MSVMRAGEDMQGLPTLPDRYRVLRRIGGGGSADVLLAEDRSGPPSPKAIKILRADLPSALVANFRDEFRILASLEHSGLARVYEFGELPSGRAYYTVDYVDGRELGSDGPPTARDACLAIAAVCRTLAYLHARGYVHNDVTPTNILVGRSPETARLLDFGLAGLARGRSRTVAGTPGYIAPERLAGESWDSRADLYSVGATLYRVLGGRRVTDADRPTQALLELRSGRRPLGDLRPDLPEALVALIERLLSLDPAARPRHAFEVIELLGEALGEVLPLETPGSARCYALSSIFVGREAELADLEQGLRDAEAMGRRRILAVSGGAGSGKSRLLRELATRAETSGFRVARAACADRSAALEPVARLFAQLGLPPDRVVEDVGDTARALAEASAENRGGTLLMLDEAHRASDAVFQVLLAAVERKSKLVVALAFDGDGLSSGTRQRLALATAAGSVQRVELGPLARTQLQRMLVSLFGEAVIPEPVADSIAQRSSGNPLLLEEIVREMVETGMIRSTASGWTIGEIPLAATTRSARLEDFLRRRCQNLPQDATATLTALAVLGGRARMEAVAAIAGGTDVALGAALLGDRGLVSLTADELALEQDALCAVALEGLSSDRRRTLFRAAASWMTAHGADDVELARVHREAGDAADAFEHARRGGMRARDAGDGRIAVRSLEEAIAVAEEAGIRGARLSPTLQACGEAYRMVGRPQDALRTLERAFTVLPATASRDRVWIATRAVREALVADDRGLAEVWLSRAASALDPDDHFAAASVAFAAGTIARTSIGGYAQARVKLREAIAALDRADDTPEVRSLRASVLVTLVGAESHFDLDAAGRIGRDGLEAARKSGNRFLVALAQNNLAHMLLVLGDLRGAREAAEEVLQESERSGNAPAVFYLLLILAETHTASGAWDAARACMRRAMLVAEASGGSLPAAHGIAALCAWHEGDMTAVAREGSRALSHTIAILQGEMLTLYMAMSAAAADRGDVAEASVLAERAATDARLANAPVDSALVAVVHGYHAAASDPLEGGAKLRAAADAMERVGHRCHLPLVLRDAARFLTRAGDRAAARVCVRRARELLLARGCAPGIVRLEEIESAPAVTVASTRPPAPRLSAARSIDELARTLRALGHASGLQQEVRVFAALDGAMRERGRDREDARSDLPARAARALEGTLPTREGELTFHPIRAGALSACIVTASQEPLATVSLLVEAAEMGLAALDARAGRSSDREEVRTQRVAGEGDPASRLLELTVGPIELRHDFDEVVGRSSAMTRALALLDRLSDTDAPVLLTGETGTGKEVFARALHTASRRRDAPFVTVNCAAVPATLFEAELFGYRRGAFTGALRDQAGHARKADGGVLFLDEVGELPLEIQPKLLRLLQERKVQPLGGVTESPVDIRVVAATNRDLGADVTVGRFRADLYYRLNVVEICLPPLRERPSDIPELVRHLLARMGRSDDLSARTMKRFVDYPWPGNVRELENELQRACILAGHATFDERHLSPKLRKAAAAKPTSTQKPGTLAERVASFEREVIEQALEASKGNRSRAAKALGLTRQGLLFKLKRRGMDGKPKR